MPSYSKNEVILVRYPFSALSGVKVRPAIIVNAPHESQDIFIVPLTSRTTPSLPGSSSVTTPAQLLADFWNDVNQWRR